MKGTIQSATTLSGDPTLTCDVCIVGSGAGGAVLAAGLCAAGLDVVMLEEGSHYTAEDFTLHERDALPNMYQERGTRSTDDLAFTVMQGRTVGGSTTVNWTTCFRTPERILNHWEAHHGLGDLDLDPHFAAIEERLSIAPWPESLANANNQALSRGAQALGYDWGVLRRNVKGCANSGYCGLGCPVEAKQAMAVTTLQDALAAGLRLISEVRVQRLETDGRRVVAVHGQAMPKNAGLPVGPTITVRAKVTVSSAGAINGPALLLRSGLDGGGRVGRRTYLHPVVGSLAWFEEPIRPFYGAPQSVGSHHFIDRGPDRVGYFLEAAPLQPMLAAVAAAQFGPALHDAMSQLAHTNGLIALSVDGLLPHDDGGTVSLHHDGRPKLSYPIRPFLQESLRDANKTLARIQFAAGAKRVTSGHHPPVEMLSAGDVDLLDAAPYEALKVSLFTAHQMGGCAMHGTAGVVDREHRFRGMDNLFVVDGSVLPTALGVNPSETIYALAHRAIPFVVAAAG